MRLSTERVDFARVLRAELADATKLVAALRLDERMKRQPRGVIVCCPAHEEHNPSCSVREGDDGTISVRCHACGFTGDALTLVAQACGLDTRSSFRDVLRVAAEIAGRYDVLEALDGRNARAPVHFVAPPSKAPPPKPERDAERERATSVLVDLPELERAHVDGWRYLEERGIVAYGLALGVRFLPPFEKQSALVDALLLEATRAEMQHASILRSGGDGLEWPEHRMLIPWRRRDGSIALLQRRLLRDELEGERKYQVQRGAMVDLEPFGAHAFALAAPTMLDADVVIVEGALDVAARMTLAMHAGENVFVLGAFNVTSASLHDWAPFVVGRRVRIAIDADDAGDANAPELAAAIMDAGAREVVRERPIHGKDWGEALMWSGRTAA